MYYIHVLRCLLRVLLGFLKCHPTSLCLDGRLREVWLSDMDQCKASWQRGLHARWHEVLGQLGQAPLKLLAHPGQAVNLSRTPAQPPLILRTPCSASRV